VKGFLDDKIFVTGNTIVDAVQQNLGLANRHRSVLTDLELEPKKYFLVTAHRQENVDVKARFDGILTGLQRITSEYGLPVIYPIHPRARKMMSHLGIQPKGIKLIEAVDYLSFLQLESQAKNLS